MTTEEKAHELIKKYVRLYIDNPKFKNEYLELAKRSALICVDEILNSGDGCIIYMHDIGVSRFINYWSEVKQEIKKL